MLADSHILRAAVLLALSATGPVVRARATAQADGAAAAGVVEYADLELSLELPKLEGLTAETSKLPTAKGTWSGQLGSSRVHLSLHALAQETYDFFEPEDVIETWRDSMRDPQTGETQDTVLAFEPIRCIARPAAGCTPIVATVQGSVHKKSDPATKGTVFLAAALLPENGWLLRADCIPPLDEAAMRTFAASLEKCVTYKGKPCDPKWSDDGARAFWQQIAPESTWKKFEKPVRTKHFIVLTNATSPGPFVKKLEGWYEAIAKIVPTDEFEGRKLLPIVLFRTDDDFQNFYRAYYKMEAKEEVQDVSVAVGHWVATSCDFENEYQRMFDMCTQVMTVRARANDGNAWFRLGLSEYAARKPRDRAPAYKAVKKGRYVTLAKLFDNEVWNKQYRERDMTGTSEETSYWDQGALWMEFLHTGPWPKESFPRFVRTIGSIPRTDDAAIGAAIESIYGTDLATLEKKWVAFCSKK